jgi:hypothetical protein
MKKLAVLLLAMPLLACSLGPTVWRDQVLPSGATVKVTSLHLAWGLEHGERDTTKDCLVLSFVSADPAASAEAQEREAREVFELIRPATELWSFESAVVAAHPSVEQGGSYEVFTFRRASDGGWSCEHRSARVHGSDPGT